MDFYKLEIMAVTIAICKFLYFWVYHRNRNRVLTGNNTFEFTSPIKYNLLLSHTVGGDQKNNKETSEEIEEIIRGL